MHRGDGSALPLPMGEVNLATLDVELDRHVFRLDAAQRQALDEPFAHLADASVVVDPYRQEIAPVLVRFAAHGHAAGYRNRWRLQDLVGAEVWVLGDRGEAKHQRIDDAIDPSRRHLE